MKNLKEIYNPKNILAYIFLVAIITSIFSCNPFQIESNEISFKSSYAQNNPKSDKRDAEMGPTVSKLFTPNVVSIRSPLVIIGNKTFLAEIADSVEERQTGLSNRDFLEQSSGMLFVYPDNAVGGFWMLDMRFPLDFIWIGKDCTVVDLTENVVVETNQEELHVYYSTSHAAFNFEVNAGEIELSNIQIGDIVQLKNIHIEGIECGEQ